MQMNIKMIPCPKCGNDFPELRVTQYGYNFCVECSTVGAKRGVPVQMGQGDHTWTETVIMDEEVYNKITDNEGENSKDRLNLEEDDRNLQGPYTIINK